MKFGSVVRFRRLNVPIGTWCELGDSRSQIILFSGRGRIRLSFKRWHNRIFSFSEFSSLQCLWRIAVSSSVLFFHIKEEHSCSSKWNGLMTLFRCRPVIEHPALAIRHDVESIETDQEWLKWESCVRTKFILRSVYSSVSSCARSIA